MVDIPPIPRMTKMDEEWVDYASDVGHMPHEVARGLLAAYYTMRGRKLAIALEFVRCEIKNAEQALVDLSPYEEQYPEDVATDRAMWNALIPQLQELLHE